MPTAVAYDPARLDTGSNTATQERMVIMNADLTIVIPDPQARATEIEAMAKSLGGYVVSMNMYQTSLYDGGTAPEGYISIRIPSDKLESALGQIKANVVEVRSETRSSEDVTASYVDLQSRLSALEAARDQLQTIMDAATKTEDVLNVFNQLQYYNEQIEMVKGQMKYYEESSSTSLINVTLVAEVTIQPLEIGPWTPKGAAQNAYKALVNFLRGFVEFVIWLGVVVLPVILIIFGPIVLVIWLIVRGVKRSKAKKQVKSAQ
jgi:prefoldin subunit 5